MLVCASGFGVGGLINVGLCLWVWGWWAGVGRAHLAGGRSVVVWASGLVGWGWSVVVCA